MAKLSKREKFKISLSKVPLRALSIKDRLKSIKIKRANTDLIAFRVSGGMGDHIMAAKFISDISLTTGGLEFDVYCTRPSIGEWIFRSIPGCRIIGDLKSEVKALRPEYRYIIETLTFARVIHKNKIKPPTTNIDLIADSIELKSQSIEYMMNAHPHLDGYLGNYTVMKGYRRHNFLHWMAGINYSKTPLHIPIDVDAIEKYCLSHAKFITISNGYDEGMQTNQSQSATKVYPHFDLLIDKIKSRFPTILIVQIGSTTSTRIKGVDIDLINKTSLKEVASIIQHSKLHIDNEGGLVHLAASLRTRSCVMFGPTLHTYFGYEENINVPPATCGGCWWMEPTWMSRCVKGHTQPACLYNRTADSTFPLIEEHLEQVLIE